ncbi:MAG TPA: L,D-transpeptidase family protein [Bauldia sp.]|nr:L,D-transpeptidase family protein [Bauldia sp.]
MAGRVWFSLAVSALAAMALAGCQESDIPKDIRPVPASLSMRMQKEQMVETSPVLIRIFKEESALEVWKQRRDGTYGLLKTYKICKWSGTLGPKVKEGDRQAPEGFYTITPAQMNPQSKYYLSFNIGYPNEFDQALGRTGSNIMVHGACSSAGCYSMTDADSGELFALARDAFRGGQTEFQIEAFPFRMTAENMARHRDNPNMPFWKMLKVGYDHFEVTHRVPKVNVCNKSYIFNADAAGAPFRPTAPCPPYTIPATIASAVAAKQAADAIVFDATVTKLADAARKAEEAKLKAAETPEQPSLFSRLIGRGTKPAEPAPTTLAVIPPIPRTAPGAANAVPGGPQAPVSVAAIPIPRGKPKLDELDAVAEPVVMPKLKTAARTPDAAAADIDAKARTADAKISAPKTLPKPVIAPAPVTAEPVATPAVTADTSPAAAPATPVAAASTPAATPGTKTVGTIVKRKFIWPGDDDDATPAAD